MEVQKSEDNANAYFGIRISCLGLTNLNVYALAEELAHLPPRHSHRSIGCLSQQLAVVPGINGQLVEAVIRDCRISPRFFDPPAKLRAEQFVHGLSAPVPSTVHQ